MSIIILAILAFIVSVGALSYLSKPLIGVIVGAALSAIIVLAGSFTVISAGHVGVQVTLGEVNQTPLTEGVHLVNPISSIKDVDVRLAKAELKNASAGTKDLQQVHTDIVVQFRLDPNQVPHIYKEFGLNVDEKVLGPGINEAFKSVTARFNSEELITKRDLVSAEILTHLRDKMKPFNITVNGVSLVNFAFNAEYQKAIEAKVTATQAKLKAEQDLQRIEVEAKSRIAEAMGEARAIQIQAEAISRNGGDNYVKLKALEKWDGKMPNTVVNGSGSGLMLNLGK
jgi:prohibitin 2